MFKQFFHEYESDAETYEYNRLGDSIGLPVQGKGGVTTSGSSTTISAAVTYAFAGVVPGSVIFFTRGDTIHVRKVASVTDGDTLVVDTAVDLSVGQWAWSFYPLRTADDAYHNIGQLRNPTLFLQIDSINDATSVDFIVESVSPNIGGLTTTVFSQNYTAAGTDPVIIGETVQAIRVGVKVETGETDNGAIVSAWLVGR